jgi:hypothetical protein
LLNTHWQCFKYFSSAPVLYSLQAGSALNIFQVHQYFTLLQAGSALNIFQVHQYFTLLQAGSTLNIFQVHQYFTLYRQYVLLKFEQFS